MGQAGKGRMRLSMGHPKNVLTRSILGVERPDCAGMPPATSSRRRRPPRRRPPPSGTPFPPIPARCRQKSATHRGLTGKACALARMAPHRPARGPKVPPARQRTRANAAHARPTRLLSPPHCSLAKLRGKFHHILLAFMVELQPRARRGCTRA